MHDEFAKRFFNCSTAHSPQRACAKAILVQSYHTYFAAAALSRIIHSGMYSKSYIIATNQSSCTVPVVSLDRLLIGIRTDCGALGSNVRDSPIQE